MADYYFGRVRHQEKGGKPKYDRDRLRPLRNAPPRLQGEGKEYATTP